jgi:Trk K+ transport system NAD-binding subunit
MILVTTAGQVGSEAARLLTRRGELVRVLVVDRDTVAATAQAGADATDCAQAFS